MRKHLWFLAISLLVSAGLLAQQGLPAMPPRFTKQAIPGTACFAYLPQQFNWDEVSKSDDGSEVHVGNAIFEGGYDFGMIFVQFKEPVGDDKQVQEQLLTSYLDYLKTSFKVTASAGYGKGHRLKSESTVIGVIDYWNYADSTTSSVKGWINPSYLAVYIINYKKEVNIGVREMFFEGLRVPPQGKMKQ